MSDRMMPDQTNEEAANNAVRLILGSPEHIRSSLMNAAKKWSAEPELMVTDLMKGITKHATNKDKDAAIGILKRILYSLTNKGFTADTNSMASLKPFLTPKETIIP